MSRRVLQIFVAASCLLVPWILWLSHTLPSSHVEHKWNSLWTCYDVCICLVLALTAYLGWRQSDILVMAATAAGTMVLVDAWFDLFTSSPGLEYLEAYLFALAVEVPLALLAFWVAYRSIGHGVARGASILPL